MTHKKWEPGTLYAKAMRDITNEHNATVDAWQAAEAEAERLGRANSDLCDQLAAMREPTGWELDVTADVIEVIARSSSRQTRAQEILDLCRARIKPVFECKECAYKQTRIHRLEGWVGALEGYVDDVRKLAAKLPARAALEGES